MKVSYNWLKQYVDVKLPAQEIADRLTMAGLEVKGSQTIGGDWEGIVIGQMIAVDKHHNADRLSLVTIDLGGEKQETVVCGAPNCAAGIKVAFAPVGSTLINPHTNQPEKLKPAKIRGVVSAGMACSEKELGVSENHEGILVLPPDAPIGKPLNEYLGDTIFNFEVTPNRPDCLSIIGLAREIAVLTGTNLHLPDLIYPESDRSITQDATVEILDPDLCPRYCASLITGVKIAESPEWLKKWLLSYGMRPINNIVDITNFVMLEWGQPLHAFDFTKLTGRGIVVRRARREEKITSLDGVERQLARDMLVIADKEQAVAVAGIMGGANSEVSDDTTSILLESASFKPTSVHYTGRILGMPSEACVRFERSLSPELTIPALKRATKLIAELGGGQAAKGIIDVYPGKQERKSVRITTAETKRVLGVEFTVDEVAATLNSLGFECQPNVSTGSVIAKAPYWRSDISIPVDLVEEVARVRSYDRIPTTLLAEPIPKHDPAPITGFKRKMRQALAGYGFQEIASYSMVGMDSLTRLSPQSKKPQPLPVRISNPMTIDQEYLRPTLRGNLLAALSVNRAFLEDGLRLFEAGKVYLPKDADLPDEPDMLCGAIAGRRGERWWQGDGEPVDFFDAKGIVEGLLAQFNTTARFDPANDESLHPARQAAVTIGGKQVGVVGELHPAVAGHFELPGGVYLFELNLPALVLHTGFMMYQPIPKFPATIRDIALVVDVTVPHQKIVDIVRAVSLVIDVSLFDVYAGEQVPAGKKSLAYRLTFQSPNRTLTDEEVNRVQQQILNRLVAEVDASLRG
ncbi:MAG: phenylalanine--tRNA ligase subunit beta [Dehalococcoidia bacterium]|nr:phenylalanine--tRNA ligase subunit beta [Dehalococcoidia bacterium]